MFSLSFVKLPKCCFKIIKVAFHSLKKSGNATALPDFIYFHSTKKFK